MTWTVEWYAGGRSEENPRRLRSGDQVLEVVEVMARWTSPTGRGFRVRGSDGQVYELRERASDWAVEPLPTPAV